MTNQVSHTFRKEEKLCSQKLMGDLFLTGQSFLCYPVRITWKIVSLPQEEYPVQAAFAVPKRLFGHATDRNRLKRMMRECYRLRKHTLYDTLRGANSQITLVFTYIAKEILPYQRIEPAFSKAILQLVSENSSPGQVRS